MERAAFVLTIRPERVDDYVRAHAKVWPEMRAAISAAGIRNYSIFLRGTEAYGYLEADDVGEAFARLGESEVNARWQEAMAELLDAGVAREGPEMLELIFRLE